MAEIHTFGCRLNAYESEVIRRHTDGQEELAVFNTCAVTKEAERQARQAIRRYHRKHPNKRLMVTGCAAQISPATYADLPGVVKVLGNEEKLQKKYYDDVILRSAVDEESQRSFAYAQDDIAKDTFGEEKIAVNDIMSVEETASHLVSGFEGRSRAFVQVQNGCNHRCTFCIIPYGRGNSRSVPVGEIVREVQGLVASGYNEVVLTGVDITDYGKDLPGAPTLGGMLKRVFKQVPELPRLRLSSIDVAEIDKDLLDLIANEPRLMPHLHLSMQAGDDMVLKRMKRHHTRQQILDFCAHARELRTGIVFGADIITGFPTETEAMFQNTFECVKEAEITWLHVFPYSEREGTPAARIPANKQVPVPERKARAAKLRALGQKHVDQLMASLEGTTQEVVIEEGQLGRTPHYATIPVKGGKVGELATIHYCK